MNVLKKRALTLSILLVAVLGLSLVSAGESRGPIVILGDSGFTEANGVVSGSGSEDDPYVISGWEVAPVGDEPYAVHIENTSAYFMLRALDVSNENNLDGAGIRIAFSQGGRIEACTITATNGVQIISSTGIEMAETFIYTNGIGLRVLGDKA